MLCMYTWRRMQHAIQANSWKPCDSWISGSDAVHPFNPLFISHPRLNPIITLIIKFFSCVLSSVSLHRSASLVFVEVVSSFSSCHPSCLPCRRFLSCSLHSSSVPPFANMRLWLCHPVSFQKSLRNSNPHPPPLRHCIFHFHSPFTRGSKITSLRIADRRLLQTVAQAQAEASAQASASGAGSSAQSAAQASADVSNVVVPLKTETIATTNAAASATSTVESLKSVLFGCVKSNNYAAFAEAAAAAFAAAKGSVVAQACNEVYLQIPQPEILAAFSSACATSSAAHATAVAQAMSQALSYGGAFSSSCAAALKPVYTTLADSCASAYSSGASAAASAFANLASTAIQKGYSSDFSAALAKSLSYSSAFSTATAQSLGGAFSSKPQMLCSALAQASSQAAASGAGSAFAAAKAKAGVSC